MPQQAVIGNCKPVGFVPDFLDKEGSFFISFDGKRRLDPWYIDFFFTLGYGSYRNPDFELPEFLKLKKAALSLRL